MKQQLVRDGYGRILGTVSDYWNNEDSSYVDYKESNLVFPRHNEDQNGKVHTYHISELHKKN